MYNNSKKRFMVNIQYCGNCVQKPPSLPPLPLSWEKRGFVVCQPSGMWWPQEWRQCWGQQTHWSLIPLKFSVTVLCWRIKLPIYCQYNHQRSFIAYCLSLFGLGLYRLSPHGSSAGSSSLHGNSCRSAAVTGYLTWEWSRKRSKSLKQFKHGKEI